MRKLFTLFAALAVLLSSACGCTSNEELSEAGSEVASDSGTELASTEPATDALEYGTYKWEKDGFGGDFTITLNDDGTFHYYEGWLSSYIGDGEYTYEDGIITVTDNGIPGRYGALTRLPL